MAVSFSDPVRQARYDAAHSGYTFFTDADARARYDEAYRALAPAGHFRALVAQHRAAIRADRAKAGAWSGDEDQDRERGRELGNKLFRHAEDREAFVAAYMLRRCTSRAARTK